MYKMRIYSNKFGKLRKFRTGIISSSLTSAKLSLPATQDVWLVSLVQNGRSKKAAIDMD